MQTHQIISSGVMRMTGSVAEWSKALVLGTSLSGRGFESHRCQKKILLQENGLDMHESMRANQ